MLITKDLQKIFHELKTHGKTYFFLSGFDITLQIFEEAAKLSLITPIYFGGNYIPKSVRMGISKTPPFEKNQFIKTSLKVDEENYRVFLHYLGTTENFNDTKLALLIEDFNCLADQWRIYLDEHDQKDLIYIHAK